MLRAGQGRGRAGWAARGGGVAGALVYWSEDVANVLAVEGGVTGDLPLVVDPGGGAKREARGGRDQGIQVGRGAVLVDEAVALATAAEEFVTGLHKRLAAEFETPRPQPTVTGRPRRAVIRVASVAAAAAAAGAGLDQVLTKSGPGPAPTAGGEIVPGKGSWQAVLSSAELPDDSVRSFTLSTLTGFVQRAAGGLRAVSGVCTHQGCRLVLAQAATELDCPCHNAVFALDGTVLRHRLNVELTPLPRIEVRESGGTIQVYAPLPSGSGLAAPGQ